VFEQSTGAETRHLTLKKQRSVQPIIVIQPSNSNLASWSKIPIALLSLSIVSLIGLLLLRRVFGRLTIKKSVAVEHDVYNDPFELKKGLHNPDNGKKARKKKKVAHSYALSETSREMNTEEHKRVKTKKRHQSESATRGEAQLIVATEFRTEHGNGKRKEHRSKRNLSKTKLSRSAQLAWGEEQIREQGMVMPVRPKRRT
jgi:hypothetical protein